MGSTLNLRQLYPPSQNVVERLEPRQLMTVGPVIAQQFVGTPEAVSAVVLTFDVPLDPATAQNPNAYELIKKFRSSGSDGFGGIGESESETDNDHVRIDAATYDAAANTVTLIPRNEFAVRQSFKVIVVRGRGQNAVMTAAGTELDGDANGRAGGDAVLRLRSNVRQRFTYRDSDGDRATIRLEGPGRFLYFFAKRGRSSPSIFLRDTDAATSILTGTVKQGRRGDGVVDIAQITGAGQVAFATDPAFRIRAN